MKNQSASFLPDESLAWVSPAPGVCRKVMGYDDHLMQVKVNFEAGADGGGIHVHPHSQSSVILSGVFEVTIGERIEIMQAGDGFYAPPNLPHFARCIETGTIIDSFSPVREDFLK